MFTACHPIKNIYILFLELVVYMSLKKTVETTPYGSSKFLITINKSRLTNNIDTYCCLTCCYYQSDYSLYELEECYDESDGTFEEVTY